MDYIVRLVLYPSRFGKDLMYFPVSKGYFSSFLIENYRRGSGSALVYG
jgi:hypothetical protein